MKKNFKQAMKEMFEESSEDDFFKTKEKGLAPKTTLPVLNTTNSEEIANQEGNYFFDKKQNNKNSPQEQENSLESLSSSIPKLTEMENISGPMQTTIISSGTSISGELISDGHVEIFGTLIGNIKAKGDIKISGKVVGDITGSKIELEACNIQGNIESSSSVFVSSSAVVFGDILASDSLFDGKLKGDITVEKTITLKEHAILLGKVSAEAISIQEGAKLYGEINIANSNVYESIFQQK
ncbi:MAG: polymer-forming cytoskeletal protein [Clostridia bacterium]